MGEYTRLIANVNGALDRIENGEDTVAKALKADTAESTEWAGAVQTAKKADSVKKAQSASFGCVVPDIGISLVRSIDYEDGYFVFDHNDHLPDGVYIIVAKAKGYNHTRNGVFVVEGTKQSYCRLSTYSDDEGATFSYFYYDDGVNPKRAAFEFLEEYGEEQSPEGTAYFYRIGTLKKEG